MVERLNGWVLYVWEALECSIIRILRVWEGKLHHTYSTGLRVTAATLAFSSRSAELGVPSAVSRALERPEFVF